MKYTATHAHESGSDQLNNEERPRLWQAIGRIELELDNEICVARLPTTLEYKDIAFSHTERNLLCCA